MIGASMNNRTAPTTALGVAIAVLLSLTVLPAQKATEREAPAAATASLTALDRIQIQQLVRKYAWALDSGDNYGYAYADLFTPDGVLVGRAVPFSQGREQLAALGRLGRSAQNPGGTLQVRHYAMNHVITPTADGATGTQYLAVIVPGDGQSKPGFVSQGGRFDDVYAKTPQGWRFKRRTYVPSREGY